MIAVQYGSGGSAGKAVGLRMDLLWENDDLSSDFSAQTVPVDLGGYSHYMVVPIFSKSTQNTVSPVILPVEDGIVFGMLIGSSASSNNGARTGYYDSSVPGIVFASARYNGSTDNSYAIPKFIYGIKSGSGSSSGGGGGGGGSGVTSVNGMTGAVVLDAADVGALPDTTQIIATDDGAGNVTLSLG